MAYNIYLGENQVDTLYLGDTEATESFLLGSKLNQENIINCILTEDELNYLLTEDETFFIIPE